MFQTCGSYTENIYKDMYSYMFMAMVRNEVKFVKTAWLERSD